MDYILDRSRSRQTMKASKDLRRKSSKVLEQHPILDIAIVEDNSGGLWMEVGDIIAYPMMIRN